MTTVRVFAPEGDPVSYDAIAQLMADVYPVIELDSAQKLAAVSASLREAVADPNIRFAVAETGGEFTGFMRLFDYVMNVRGLDAAAGGVGAVGVSLAHKRQGIARALILWYLDDFRKRGATFAVLHAFRPDFYRKLGFGYGTPVHRYRFAPGTLHVAGAAGRVRPLVPFDCDALLACCERVRATTNGLFAKHPIPTERVLAGQKPRYVGVEDSGGVLRGFMQTLVTLGEAGTANANDLMVRDLHAEDAAAQAALLDYLASQRDQFAHIVIESQDAALFLAAEDPRDGSDRIIAPPATHRISETGLGIMYRLLDVPKAFAHVRVPGPPLALRVTCDDPVFAPTNGTWTFTVDPVAGGSVEAEEGRPVDATLRIGSADLASLVVGSIGLRSLVWHRRATLEPADRLGDVSALFAVDAPPRCETRF